MRKFDDTNHTKLKNFTMEENQGTYTMKKNQCNSNMVSIIQSKIVGNFYLSFPIEGLFSCKEGSLPSVLPVNSIPPFFRCFFLGFTKKMVEMRNGEPIKFLFLPVLPKMFLLGSQASTKKKMIMNHELLLKAFFIFSWAKI